MPPFSVSAEARRENPAVQHDPASVGQPRSQRGIAGALRGRGQGGRGSRALLRRVCDGAGRQPGAGRPDDRTAADAHPVVDGVLLFAAACARHSGHACTQAIRPHLRPLLVGGAVCGGCAGHAENPGLRRHGLAEVARIRAIQAVSPVARLSAGGAQDGARGKASRRSLRSVYRNDARRVGNA